MKIKPANVVVFFGMLSFTTLPSSPEDSEDNNPWVRIIAHRGDPIAAPENTLPAIEAALTVGVEMIEIDVHQTRDLHIVLIHDEKVDKTTNGSGRVRDMTLDEIKRLDAGGWFDESFANTPVPTLEEVFRIMDNTTQLLIEIKKGSPYYPDIEARVLDLIYAFNFQDRVQVKSFETGVVEYFRKHAPDIPAGKSIAYRIPILGIIVDRGIRFGSVYNYDAAFLHAHRYTATEGFIRRAKRKGFDVYVWDVQTEKHMRKFISYGVDAIETDYPGMLRRILEEQ